MSNVTRFWAKDPKDGINKLHDTKGRAAVSYSNGDVEHYRYGTLHNTKGPAVKSKLKGTLYYLFGEHLTQQEWKDADQVVVQTIYTPLHVSSSVSPKEPKEYKTIKALRKDFGKQIPRDQIQGKPGHYQHLPK